MASGDVIPGTVGLWQGRRVRVLESPMGDSVVILDEEEEILQVPLSQLQVLKPESDRCESALAKIPAEDWKRAEKRAALGRALLALEQGRSDEVTEVAKRLGISERTVWRALAVLKQDSRTSALLPSSRGRKSGCRVLDTDRELIVADLIDKEYLTREKPSLAHLHGKVETACRARGLEPVCRKALKARVAAYGKQRVARRREGGKTARALHGAAPGHFLVAKPLEVVQIDHTLADVMLVSDDEFRQVIGRPWLTVAIDIATRIVLGFSVSLDPPSTLSVALCMTSVMLPKQEWLASLGITAQWPHGKPQRIHMDNAKEFRGIALRRGCEEHGISSTFRPVGRAHYGGHVERLVGTTMGYCHVLPGTTKSNVVNKGSYDSEARAVMTLGEFQAWLAMQIATGYHMRPHRGLLGIPPLLAWRKSMGGDTDQVAPLSTANHLETLVTFLPAEHRVVRRTGVEVNANHYWAQELAEFINDGEQHLVHYDPRDVTRIYVRGSNGVIVEAMVTDPRVPRVSLTEWRQTRRRLRKSGRTAEFMEARVAGAIASDGIVAGSKKATKAARRQTERNRQGKKAVDAVTKKSRAVAPPPEPLSVDFSKAVQRFDVLK